MKYAKSLLIWVNLFNKHATNPFSQSRVRNELSVFLQNFVMKDRIVPCLG